MFRLTTRIIAILCASLVLHGALAISAVAAPGGNAGSSTACADGGYLDYTRTDGTTFKNEGQCVKYAAQGNPLVPVVTEDPAVTRCKQEAIAAGFDPSAYNIIAGTEAYEEALTPTAGPDLICGFGGEDYVHILSADDVFLGGDGNDVVNQLYGTFNGGAGEDAVFSQYGGTFNGGDGNDWVNHLYDGTFNGGAGDDRVNETVAGTFNGGDGNDYVVIQDGGTFNGDDGNDYVTDQRGGTFNGGAGDDYVVTDRSDYFGRDATFNQD